MMRSFLRKKYLIFLAFAILDKFFTIFDLMNNKDSSSFLISSSIISLQRSTHSLHIYTLGPAISFFTSSCDFPQNELEEEKLWADKAHTFL